MGQMGTWDWKGKGDCSRHRGWEGTVGEEGDLGTWGTGEDMGDRSWHWGQEGTCGIGGDMGGLRGNWGHKGMWRTRGGIVDLGDMREHGG